MGTRSARHRRGRAGASGGSQVTAATGPVPDDDTAALAVRRLQRALGEPGSRGARPTGWVPTRPPPQQTPPTDLMPHGGQPPRDLPTGRRPPVAPSRLAAVADRVPVRLRAAVVAPAGRAVVALLVLVLVAVLAAAVTTWLTRPRELPAPARARLVGAPLSAGPSPGAGSTPGADPLASAATASTGMLVVHIIGAVRRPGVVELPAGSRVADAVAAAGGITRRGDPASVNLARPAVDGEQVVVARRGAAGTALPPGAPGAAGAAVPGGTGPGVTAPAAPVDLNTATLEQLDALPGIGPVLAQRILDWRAANGRYSTVEELGEVSGIGEATLGDLRPLVTV